jgi:hypothetical protein
VTAAIVIYQRVFSRPKAMLVRILVILCCCICSSTLLASEQLQITIANWQIDHTQLKNVQFDLAFTTQGLELKAGAESISLPAPIGQLKGVELLCHEVVLQAAQFQCQQGELSFKQQDIGQQTVQFKIDADPDNKTYHITTSGLSLASSKIALDLRLVQQHWHLKAKSAKASIKQVRQFISPYLSSTQNKAMAEWQLAGTAAFTIDAKGNGDQFKVATLNVRTDQLEVSDQAGQYVTEGLEAALSLVLKQQKSAWHWQVKLSSERGQAYAEPIFMDLAATPLNLQGKGIWYQQSKKLEVTEAMFKQQGVLQAKLNFLMSKNEIAHLNVDIKPTTLAPLYQHWLQPFTVGSAVDNLTVLGEVSLRYQQQAEGYQLQLGLDKVSVNDTMARFEFKALTGDLAWTNQDTVLPINLQWQSGTLYSIPIGRSQLTAQSQAEGLTLLAPWQIPILDGELKIKEFALQSQADETTHWTFEGLLTPISMTALSQKLGWPTLQGKLSGVIPKVTYEEQQIKVDGALMVKLFKGTTIIHDLRLSNPLGAIPQLYGNIDLIGFDLETMTDTFDFGKITGKLEGKIQNLRLANWQPVAFDAYIRTPKNDKTRHRISQQAINSLSELGGGASGLLSRSALGFFDDFSYQRLGLSCHLINEVCEMTGVEEAERGYYIVKGGGLPPRINVKGFTRRVDWPVLVDRLKAVSRSAGPVVQ